MVESISVFTALEKTGAHLKCGIKWFIISATFTDAAMSVMDLNHKKCGNSLKIVSNSPHQALDPSAEVIKRAPWRDNMDGPSGKLACNGHGAAQNSILTSTGVAKATDKVIPELIGKLTSMAFHVPTLMSQARI
ncbi:Glyceraldehyde-3-phosphate dehydrogenase [Galemys pyrenaicus]|uniref:Glyceraldehyde-3-phosphate dehydrogenase n=1 Tax=Galemys pyrenaicus TaxID=202257 RepID=A0A8J6DWJ7_GALPY|nr:Glyceraldehyde-3-phosphate dehydrogenase [Galemys pyrenaicus]